MSSSLNLPLGHLGSQHEQNKFQHMNMQSFRYLAVLLTTLVLCAATLAAQPAANKKMNDDRLKPYEAEWRAIDSLDNNGLPKSALEAVEALRQRAIADGQTAHSIRALVYALRLDAALEEDGQAKAIARMTEEVEQAAFPAKAILQNLLASQYAAFLEARYWQLRNRTDVPDYKPADVNTWSGPQLEQAAAQLYLTSLADERLRQLPIADYKALLLNDDKPGRPTLYDVLAFRAIEHFSNQQSRFTQPANRFYIDQAAYFAPAAEFVATPISAQDEQSGEYLALQLYQQLLAAHQADADPSARLDADLLRLAFVHNKSTLPEKDELYKAALLAFEKAYSAHPAAAEAMHARARQLHAEGREYDPQTKAALQWRTKEAKALCEAAIKRYPESRGAQQCAALLKEIQSPSLGLQAESVVPAQQPILIHTHYQNLAELHYRLIKLSEAKQKELERQPSEEAKFEFLKKQAAAEKGRIKLPDLGDYQRHNTEWMLKGQAFGQYCLLVADNAKFDVQPNAAAYMIVAVSNLASMTRSGEEGKSRVAVVDRSSGKPLPGVKVEFMVNEYDRRQQQYEKKKIGEAQSDANGMVQTNFRGERHSYFSMRLSKGADVLDLPDSYSSWGYVFRGQARQGTQFFLDRMIYRPGQAVFYKALALQYDANGVPSVLGNEKITITFKDVNGQDIASSELVTNEFGSVHGSFTAPIAGLRGAMSLHASIGGAVQSLRVEEYKRPKFEVKVSPLEGDAQLGDTVTVAALAEAFAGNTIEGAQVSYRVVRRTRFPWMPWYGYRMMPPTSSDETEIANGETTTDAAGNISIEFLALPDLSVRRDQKPAFTYTVYIDVTDLTGETQSSSAVVTLGYLSLQAAVDMPEGLPQKAAVNIGISTTNLNGQPLPATGTVRIHRLDAPKQVFIERYWPAPDQHILSAAEFRKHFPLLPYQRENEPDQWAKLEELYQSSFNTAEATTLTLDTRTLPVGHYALTLSTADKSGEVITVQRFFTVHGAVGTALPAGTALEVHLDKSTYAPGDAVQLAIGTAGAPLHVLYEVERLQKMSTPKWIDLSAWANEALDVTEADKGNFHIGLTYVRHNRFHTRNMPVQVPWADKELKLEWATFRDKLRPGQPEEWRVKISGPAGERVAAEMVAAMYDASLDQFAANRYTNALYPRNNATDTWRGGKFDAVQATTYYNYSYDSGLGMPPPRIYPTLEGGLDFNSYQGYGWGGQRNVMMRGGMENEPVMMMDGAMPKSAPAPATYMAESAVADTVEEQKGEPATGSDVPVRTNLNETVFFMPQLMTDAEGHTILSFTMNEALTRWKFLSFAHTRDLKTGTLEGFTVTQKELMVQPNPPRFLREGDQIEYRAKVSNLSDQPLSGTATLSLFSALDMGTLDAAMDNADANRSFTLAPGASQVLAWRIAVPRGQITPLTHRVVARAGAFSDGEESTLPVLTNRMLVTESLPLPISGKGSKTFTMERLQDAAKSPTLQHHALTLEFTSNPAWYAVKALPYLMEYPYDCTEQVFSRLYANTLASSVANRHPRVRSVFDSWKGTAALESPLAQNEALKSALLTETPWVLAAQSETEQRQHIGLLFDLTRMAQEQDLAMAKLIERQSLSGGFSWFPGGQDNWHMTQYIVEGFGRLNRLGAMPAQEGRAGEMLRNARTFIDRSALKAYDDLAEAVKRDRAKWDDDHLSSLLVHYLYTTSLYPKTTTDERQQQMLDYYLSQAEAHWLRRNVYEQAMIGLSLHRHGKVAAAQKIVRSLRERALTHKELGTYWKQDQGYYWYQLPVETHCQVMELFAEVAKDEAMVEGMKTWLLKNKQTTHWKTTTATANAVYALLSHGDDWLAEAAPVTISFPDAKANDKAIAAAQQNAEAGTGYFKAHWAGAAVSPSMAAVRVKNSNKGVAWGALHWQYFEDLDKVTHFAETPLTLQKQMLREENTDRGPVLRAFDEASPLQVGDKLVVRLELRVDRDMEYVHLKDLRASGLEPINTLSQYRWQGGLGYYESTGDVATNFFIDYLPKGTYVFEYTLRASFTGQFSSGVTSIQCMYAPEFSSHSEGKRLSVE